MTSYLIPTKTCTCDEIGEGPCPAHGRENALQDRLIWANDLIVQMADVISKSCPDASAWEDGLAEDVDKFEAGK